MSNPAPDHGPNEFEQLKGTFLSSLNHEIRTPLSGILGMTDLLLETSLDDDQREYVQATRVCAESLFHILNATLEYSALEAGTLRLDETEFCLRELVESVVSSQKEKTQAKGLDFSLSIDSALPETLIGDAVRLRDILSHLIDNAIKFTNSGGVQVELRPVAGTANTVLISVKDSGVGIASDQVDSIFQSFRQGEGGLARGYAGLGLGLALVRKLLTLMGGEISVVSELDRGSTFTIRLPLHVAHESVHETAKETPGGQPQTGGPWILAVDDNAVGMMVLRHALRGKQVQIDGAEDGPSAIAAAKRRQYDLILMDLQMPGMDGLTATREIRNISGYENVPILALTADFSDEIRRECLEHGMQGFLSKPLESTILWATVSRHLNLPG